MEQEKDNFWLYVGGLVLGVVVLVIMFKGMKQDDIPSKAFAETSSQIDAQIEKQHRMRNNDPAPAPVSEGPHMQNSNPAPAKVSEGPHMWNGNPNNQ